MNNIQYDDLAAFFLDFLGEDAPTDNTIITITDKTPLGGMQYPFLARTGKRWQIHSEPATTANCYATGQLARWVNGNAVYDLHLDGIPYTSENLAATLGLKLNQKKGGFVLSKRWSRIMRPYHMSMFLPCDEVQIRYLDHDTTRDQVWDGAGTISRTMLLKMRDHLPNLNLSPRLRHKLSHELETAKRVEFTIQGAQGQDKGHAIVSETQTEDFVLIQDTKKEVKSTDGMTMIGINLVHAHTHMRLDIQSLINLRGNPNDPFWTNDLLLNWLRDTSTVFQQSLEQGDVNEAMSILDGEITIEDVQAWHIREYFLSKGQAMAFATIIKTLMNQHLKAIRATNLNNLRLPMIGGRFYVMPVGVGQAAGLDLHVRPGHVLLDQSSSTAWVNDHDWLHLSNSANGAGIAQILGGADNDDALWCHGFTDHDGDKKVLCWRSPNQFGEYVLLKPEPVSYEPTWYDGTTTTSTYSNDSRKLPARIDSATPDYLNLVTPDSTVYDETYSIDTMNTTIERITNNEGALGMYCNLLMLSQALYNRQPKQPAARLEAIIDASVKTGDDLTQIKEYCYAKSSVIIDTGCAIPKALWKRLSIRRDEHTPRPKLTATTTHWLDLLIEGIQAEINAFTNHREALMQRAQPPLSIFQYAMEHKLLQAGGAFNSTYARTLQQTSQISPEAGFDLARQATEAFLVEQRDQHTPEAILIGALANCYLNHSSDAAVWQPGIIADDDARQPGIANLTLTALRQLGFLEQLSTDDHNRVIRYPVAPPNYHQTVQLTMNGVWFNYLLAQGLAATHMSDVDKATADSAKAAIKTLADQHLSGYSLTLKTSGDRVLAYGPQGHLFAYIDRKQEHLIHGAGCTIITARADNDGNIAAVCQFQ